MVGESRARGESERTRGERGANAGRNGRGVGANKGAPGAVVVGVGALRGRSVNKKRLLGKNSQPPPR